MKKAIYTLTCLAITGALTACGGGNKKAAETAEAPATQMLSYSKSMKAAETDSLALPVDKDGYITIFDGKPLTDGEAMVRRMFRLGGLSKMDVSSLMEAAVAKLRLLKAVT